jgi:hypothetical protein
MLPWCLIVSSPTLRTRNVSYLTLVSETKENDCKKKSVRKAVSCLLHCVTIRCNSQFTGRIGRSICTRMGNSILVRKLGENRQIAAYRRKGTIILRFD